MKQYKKTIRVFSDGGHAWAKVKRKELVDLGINSAISSYSYQFKDNVYLEEDCDMSTYINALKLVKGITREQIKFNETWTNRNSKIRNYSNYNACNVN
jgi:hypothetical protein